MAKGRVHAINLAVYPQVLTVAPGDTVRVTTEFDYVGPAISCRMISAIWHPTFFDPHDEIVRGNKSFSIPSSPPPGNHISVTMNLLVPSGEIGTDYGLYSSIRDIPGPDIYCEPKWLENIITIEEVVPAEYTLEVTIEPPGAGHVLISPKGPYSPGEVVTLVATPYSGYEFDHWGGWPPYPGIQSTSSTLKLTMTANWWVVAAFREVALPKGELVSAYAYWEALGYWLPIGETNTWPPYTSITTAWKVKNTGDKSVFFKVRFKGKTSAGVLLSPGGEATLYLYPVTPSAGTYDYTLDIIADNTVVRQYPIRVTVA